jgi:hypothetical protein
MVLKGASQEVEFISMVTTLSPPGVATKEVGKWEKVVDVSSAEHKACYQKYWRHAHRVNLSSLQRWNGRFRGDAYIGGDCTRIQA